MRHFGSAVQLKENVRRLLIIAISISAQNYSDMERKEIFNDAVKYGILSPESNWINS